MDMIYVVYWSQSGKTIDLFGSYGWGNGQWMRDWTDRMNGCGANVLNGEGQYCSKSLKNVKMCISRYFVMEGHFCK